MHALNFQERFALKVASGEKRQTIRRVWKRPIKAGDKLYLYTGMRTKRCRPLRTAVCLKREAVLINEHSISAVRNGVLEIWTEGEAANWFARLDGFDSWEEMRDWFKARYGLPFEGVLIMW